MAKGLSISVVSDTREFVSGIQKGIVKPLEDVEKSLEDVQSQGDKAGEKLEQSFSEARTKVSDFKRTQSELGKVIADGSAQTQFSRNTRRATDEAGDDFKRLGRTAKDSLDDIGTAGNHSFGHGGIASEAVDEFKDEARQNFGEVVSSFDGSMGSIQDLAQGTLGGLAASFTGPLGLAVGAGGAAIGLLSGFYQAWQQKQQETDEANAQDVASMFDDMLESGKDYLSADFLNKTIQQNADDAKKWAEAQDVARESGIKLSVVQRAQAGDQEALAIVQKSVNDQVAAGNKALGANSGAWDDNTKAVVESAKQAGKAAPIVKQWSANWDAATGKLGSTREAQKQVGDEATKTATKVGNAASNINDSLDLIHKNTNVKVTVDTTEWENFRSSITKNGVTIPVNLKPARGSALD